MPTQEIGPDGRLAFYTPASRDEPWDDGEYFSDGHGWT